MDIGQQIATIKKRIAAAECEHGRPAGCVTLLAATKRRSVDELRQAVAGGLRCFGESYVQEARDKIQSLRAEGLQWHFIGPLQSNKTRAIAVDFDWVHSVDRLAIARRLSEQRPEGSAPLSVCLQVNISGEGSKAGVAPAGLAELAGRVATLPRLRLRGLMAIPRPIDYAAQQTEQFARLRGLFESLLAEGFALDTLSMGMTNDLEPAIAQGATLVRVGTGLFGPRD